MSKTCVDTRGYWNSVQKLATSGDIGLANVLVAIAGDQVIASRLYWLAEKGGYPGGYGLSKEAAVRTLDEYHSGDAASPAFFKAKVKA